MTAIFLAFWLLQIIENLRQEILSVFLDIPEETVQDLHKVCEAFHINLAMAENENEMN